MTAEQHEETRKFEELGSAFVFLSDMDGELAALYAGLNAAGTNNPAVYVIDSRGRIVYRHVNDDYEIRSKAADVLDAVRKAQN